MGDVFPPPFVLNVEYRISLVETAAAQIIGDNDVCDCVEHKLNVVRVGGTGHVAVNLLRGRLVLRFKLCLDVRSRFAVLLRTYGGAFDG